ncbi:MAG: phosphotransferase family protein [Chloroflexi bacterium]|nr:MAG: phosphotransferase family protein [Chloroflexota bacterium]
MSDEKTPRRIARLTLQDGRPSVTGSAVDVADLHPLAGGASRDSWAFTAVHADGTRERLVMRRDLATTMTGSALTRAQEFTLMQAAHRHGVTCARVRWLCDSHEPLDFPFFIMDFVDGISIGRKVMTSPELAAARTALPQQMARELARIHSLDWQRESLNFLRQPASDTPARDAVSEVYAVLDALNAHILALELALRWCATHAPEPQRITFVHGDFRVGNVLVGPDGLTAVIDWEFAHVGDPAEDLGYLCMRDWRFGSDTLRAIGLTTREAFLVDYEQASGVKVDRSAVDWWEVFGNVRWAAICLSQAQRHLSGADPSVELASLGRRSLDMQAEALALIGRLRAKVTP